MKKIMVLVLMFCFFQSLKAQNLETKPTIIDQNIIYNSSGVEVQPIFPGGMKEFYHFIGKNYKTPDIAGLKGKVLISFIIEKDGSITDIKVLKDIGYGTGNEATRVLNLSPKWTPAEQNGKTVRCAYVLPIAIETSK
jgi:periplasmic protein TonB